ncbi:hypothetical protein BH11MYX1_BH11MYX1_15820 [soil metagenome]
MTSKHAGIVVMVAMALCASRRVHADNGIVVVGGAAAEHDRTTVRTAIEASAREAGWSLREKPLVKKEADALLNCRELEKPWTCVPATLASGGVDRVLVVAVENRQTDTGAPMVVLTGTIIMASAQTVTANQQYCEQCADDKLGQASSTLAQQMLRDLAVRGGQTMIAVKSVPVGAQVNLDSTPVGVTDHSFNTYPGKHVLIVDAPGFEREIKDVEVREGKTVEVVVILRATHQEARRATPSDGPSRLVPGIIAGAGLVVIVAGTYLALTPEKDSLTGPQHQSFYSTPGIMMDIAGAVAIGVGAYLWPWHRSSSPTMAVVSGGAVAGWTTTF